MAGHMSHSLNSLKGGYTGVYIGNYYRVIKGDTRSLDYESYSCVLRLGSFIGGRWVEGT